VTQGQIEGGTRQKRVIGLVLMLATALLLPSLARAACDDRPGPKMDWTGCAKQQLMLRSENFGGARFDRAVLNNIDFAASDLTGASFVATEFNRSSFREAKLGGANFTKAFAIRTNFSAARLDGANLEKAEIQRSNFTRAFLNGANLSKGDFGRSIFNGAELVAVNLRSTNVGRTSFVGARLAGADFTHAFTFGMHIEGSDLSAVKGLTQEQVDAACGDAKTRLPAGLVVSKHWPCAE